MRKVLIITYYWPPAGGPGVQRWLKFVKYLPEYGVTPIVYCPDNADYPILDPTLIEDVSNDLNVVKGKINEPFKRIKFLFKRKTTAFSRGLIPSKSKQTLIDKLLLFIRGNFFIPDARISWVKPSIKCSLDIIKLHQIDTIITTGPPHSVHLIGYNLKQKLNIKWLADFRDPWTQIGYHSKLKLLKSAQQRHLELEALVLNSANEIIVSSHQTKLLLQNKCNTSISVITNGYDPIAQMPKPEANVFSLAFIGFLFEDRNPKILWSVLAKLVQNHPEFAAVFKLNFIGKVSSKIKVILDQLGLTPYITYTGYIAHKKAQEYQHKSQVLLLIEADTKEAQYIIPGKLFEYMASKRPIIALGPQNSDIKTILSQTNTGYYFNYDEEAVLEDCIWRCFEAYKNNKLQTLPIGLENYSRKILAKEVSKRIQKLHAKNPA